MRNDFSFDHLSSTTKPRGATEAKRGHGRPRGATRGYVGPGAVILKDSAQFPYQQIVSTKDFVYFPYQPAVITEEHKASRRNSQDLG